MNDKYLKLRAEALDAALSDPELCDHMFKSYKEQKRILLEQLQILNSEIEKLEKGQVDYRHKYGDPE